MPLFLLLLSCSYAVNNVNCSNAGEAFEADLQTYHPTAVVLVSDSQFFNSCFQTFHTSRIVCLHSMLLW